MRFRLRPAALLLLLAAMGFVAAWLLKRPERSVSRPAASRQPQPSAAKARHAITPSMSASSPTPPPASTPVIRPQPGAVTAAGPGKSELQAYRLAVREGVVSLDAVERITGDFRKRRGPPPWMPGMWCVRLLDANMRVLAEDTAAAPDAMCMVLDPQNLDAKGKPQATQFAGAGEDAMLQVRLPPQPAAKWLKVYRLAGMERADWNTEPLGQLLAAIALP